MFKTVTDIINALRETRLLQHLLLGRPNRLRSNHVENSPDKLNASGRHRFGAINVRLSRRTLFPSEQTKVKDALKIYPTH
jgi:hypothetical protein